jgi:hypothetical protein
MGLAFWENGCTTPPFHFFPNFIFAKLRIHLDLDIHCWDFCFMKK